MELAVLGVYGEHPDLTDAQVDAAYEELARRYRAEATHFPFKPGHLDGLRAEVHDAALRHLTLMLDHLDTADRPSAEELRQCVNRLRSSVKRFSREGGRQGYLKFIDRELNSEETDE
ncbi:hypothetical protein C8263_08860 [Deinococcus arcticus]|uniref:Uncharacterized protein n=1 Tax=Deinococcus arcticus TaxID=2136176 RepID=A0A2T3W8N3_9DEIO|nr:hypothetical protein C8263_08860 [Deinococcus arcticus]